MIHLNNKAQAVLCVLMFFYVPQNALQIKIVLLFSACFLSLQHHQRSFSFTFFMHLYTGVWVDKLQEQESKEQFPPPHTQETLQH